MPYMMYTFDRGIYLRPRILVFFHLYGRMGMVAALVLRGFQTIQALQGACMVGGAK